MSLDINDASAVNAIKALFGGSKLNYSLSADMEEA